MSAIGRAHLDEPGAGLAHDIGHAERAADFDQLAAGDHDFTPTGEGAEQQQHSCCVVIHDRGRFRTRQFAQQMLDDLVAIPALARSQVELEIDRRGERLRDGAHGSIGQ
jgi:hypothetical protein